MNSITPDVWTLANVSDRTEFWLIAGTVAIVAVVFGTMSSVLKTREQERTRREIAAYIAEGSMTPEQGERLMKAGKDADGCG
ncbi:MAG: hypothetical protein EA378_01495 [Phycisphaerales bacterium]|nr:MAG: hypothetical protein EA378_01495 [Phycisphaerales bacterium]